MRLGSFVVARVRRGGKREVARRRSRVARLMHRQALQDFAPAEEKPGGGIGENHFAGAEALAFGDAGFIEIDQAGFGAGNQETVVRERVAQRSEAVAVELCADELAVGKNQRSRAVPRFALLRERGESRADVAREQRIVFKRGRNQREHGFIRRKTIE